MINSQSICKPYKEFLHFTIILTILQITPSRQIVAYCNYFLTVKSPGAVLPFPSASRKVGPLSGV